MRKLLFIIPLKKAVFIRANPAFLNTKIINNGVHLPSNNASLLYAKPPIKISFPFLHDFTKKGHPKSNKT